MRIGTLSEVRAPFARSFVYGAVVSLLGLLFPLTAPGVTANPGVPIDLSDLTEEKLAWRRNLFSETEFRNGLTDAPNRSGPISATTMTGYAGGISFTSGADQWAYKPAGILPNGAYTMSAVFEMTDGLGPPTIGGNAATNDAALIIGGSNIAGGTAIATPIGGNFYLVSGTRVVQASGGLPGNNGVLKYAGQSARTFKVSAYQLTVGSILQPYQALTDVSTEFLAAFPAHLLYRDNTGNVATYQLEDPIGLALDPRFAGARGNELNPDVGFDNPASWTMTGASPGWTVTGGRAVVTATAAGNRWISAGPRLVVGRTYEVFADITVVSGRALPDFSATPLPATTSGQRKHWILKASSATLQFMAYPDFVGSIDNLSVTEVYGVNVTQPTTGDRPVVSAKYNLLSASEDFSAAIWTKQQGATVTPNAYVAPSGRPACAIAASGLASCAVVQSIGVARPTRYTQTVMVRAGLVAVAVIGIRDATGNLWYPATAEILSGPGVVTGSSLMTVSGLTSAWTLVRVTMTDPATAGNLMSGYLYPGGTGTPPAGSDIGLAFMQLVQGSELIPYQRTNADGTYDYAGFPIGARFNGINSSMRVESVDGTAHTKAIIGASLRKESDAALAIPFEFTTSYNANVGGCVVFAPVGSPNSPDYAVGINSGSVSVRASPLTYPAPRLAVIASPLDMRGLTTQDRVEPIINGTTEGNRTASTGVQGTSNFAAGESFLGVRSSGGGRYTGMIYRLFLRFGDNESSNIALVIRWLNERLKANF